MSAEERWLVIAGQVGMRPDGTLREHRPCTTLLFVAGLAAPASRVDIEAWAAALIEPLSKRRSNSVEGISA